MATTACRGRHVSASHDRGFQMTAIALGRQIFALPCSLYEVLLIHSGSRKPYPGTRLWSASQLLNPATVRFLRIRNREGYDVYFRPYASDNNAGYILLDLDRPAPGMLASLWAQGHEPSIVVETSPGRLQAWIRVSRQPLPPPLATRLSRTLAQLYAADPASADWRHVGRLVAFTNRKPQRRQSDGLSPWVKLIYARGVLARDGAALIERAAAQLAACAPARGRRVTTDSPSVVDRHATDSGASVGTDAASLDTLYQTCLARLHILELYPSPDWSIADKWIARDLLQSGTPVGVIAEVLRHGSPGFPRRHADPEDYLRRTIQCAAQQIHACALPACKVPLD
jgi:hypothetical protein